ncbi:MAG TPA: hypothetical protein VGU23_00415 [Acidobacteriaceae bacterium]|nr:hypothetical protein [Acidobacteriaceae bacterium]
MRAADSAGDDPSLSLILWADHGPKRPMPDEQSISEESTAEPEVVQATPSAPPAEILPHEEPAAMLDIHDAHHAASSWREFFIHIATIVLGLLIAVSLEQTVELLHRRHQAEHARELLAAEMVDNDRILHRIRPILAMHEDYLFKDLAVLDRLRRHALQPTDRIVLYHSPTDFRDAAWQTAQQSGALALFSYVEAQRYAYIYAIQAEFSATMADSMTALQNANTMFYASAADRFDQNRATQVAGTKALAGELGEARARLAFEDQARKPEQLKRLRPEQIDRLEQTIQQGIYQDEKLSNRCAWLEQGYHLFIK